MKLKTLKIKNLEKNWTDIELMLIKHGKVKAEIEKKKNPSQSVIFKNNFNSEPSLKNIDYYLEKNKK